jgi:hypothetical protein
MHRDRDIELVATVCSSDSVVRKPTGRSSSRIRRRPWPGLTCERKGLDARVIALTAYQLEDYHRWLMFQQQPDDGLVRFGILDIVALRSGKGTRKVGFVSIRFLEQGLGQTSASMRGAGSVPRCPVSSQSGTTPASSLTATTMLCLHGADCVVRLSCSLHRTALDNHEDRTPQTLSGA